MKKHKTQEERQNLIKLFQESNLSKVNFCKVHDISPTTLRKWVDGNKDGTKSITFMQVKKDKDEIVPMPISSTGIQVDFKGISVTFPVDVGPEYLGAVFKVIANV